MTSLKKTFLLSWVLYKSGVVSALSGQMRARKQKRGGSALGDSLRKLTARLGEPWLLYIVLYGFLGVMMFKGGSELAGNLRSLDMPELFHAIYTSGISYYLLLSGFFYVSSTYYLAKDTERLLALPFTGAQIITARYLLIYLYELILPAVFCLPSWLSFGISGGESWDFYVRALLVVLLLPAVPVAILTILTMLLARFTPLVRNKDRFLILANSLTMVMSLAAVYFYYRGAGLIGEGVNTAAGASQMGTTLTKFNYVLPQLAFLQKALGGAGPEAWKNLGLALALCVLYTLVAVVIAARVYGPSLGESAGGARKRRLRSTKLAQALRRQSPALSYFAREWKLVRRSPALLMNNIFGAYMPILIMGLVFFMGLQKAGDQDIPGLLAQLREQFSTNAEFRLEFFFILAAGSNIVYDFFCAASGLNTTALSREGAGIFWMNALPLKLSTQFTMKTLLSLLLDLPIFLLLSLGSGLVLGLPVWMMALLFLSLLVSSLGTHLAQLSLDALSPNLHWDNETQMAKQGKNVLLSMFMSWLVAGLNGLLLYLTLGPRLFSAPLALILLFVLNGLLLLAFLLFLRWRLPRVMGQLERWT